MKRTFFRYAAGALSILVAVTSFNMAVLVVDREPPIADQGARALADQVDQGGTIKVEYKVFRSRICPVAAKRWLYDAAGQRHSVPQYTVGADVTAVRKTYPRTIKIPPSAAMGPAWYEVVLNSPDICRHLLS